jgi:dGTPase
VLKSYAVSDANSRGRIWPEPHPSERSEFQRDRDRIVHSTAFRRLEYKTQVFVNHEGDLFRTRLTHTIEVAQIARTIARALELNEDLVEAIALAHDLGHTPFGHAGQDALNACMRVHAPDSGGFEHNLQSLRIVDLLEERYGDFDGLNLCFETREGILKHCSAERARSLGEMGERFLNDRRPSLEAQICNLADEIAYNNHDVDDGLRSGLLTLDQLESVSIVGRHRQAATKAYPQLSGRRLIHETIRRMINALVVDLITETRRNIATLAPTTLEDIHAAPSLVVFSKAMSNEQHALKKFLNEHLYRHYRVLRMTNKARRIISDLFGAFISQPELLPPKYLQRARTDDVHGSMVTPKARAVADYIAGMTDRYAIKEHRRLFAVGEI